MAGGTGESITSSTGSIYTGPSVPIMSPNPARVWIPAIAGTLGTLQVTTDEVIDTGTITTITVAVNGLDTAITCSITDGNSGCTDAVNTVVIAEGDRVAVRLEQIGPDIPIRLNYSFTLQLP